MMKKLFLFCLLFAQFAIAETNFDADTGAGVKNVPGVLLRKPASGGSVDFGTVANPLIIQPSDGTDSATIRSLGGVGALDVSIVDDTGAQLVPFDIDYNTGGSTANIAVQGVASPSASGPAPVSSATDTVAVNMSTATTTQIVALSSGQKIYVSGGAIVSSGTNTITLKYGTGANCGTGTTSLTGPMAFTAQTGVGFNSGFGASVVVPAGNALCITTSAAVQLSGWMSYAQY